MKNVKIMLVMVFALLSMTPMKAQESELIIPDSVSMVKVATRKYCFPLDSLEYYLQMIVGKPVTLFPEELKFSEDVLSKKFITSHTFRRMKNYAQGYYDGIKITVKALEFEGVCNW
ncbi:MAG: hypothetical protein LBI53_04345 [Candidatus Peribacteria bacterium]|jgi:hypothetical protein|nr:hypothetical protein [Candidatus Peribacteria bacterium]